VTFSVVCALGRGNSKRFQDVHRELKYNGQEPKEKLEVCIIVVVLVLRSRLSVRSRTRRVCMVLVRWACGVVIVISNMFVESMGSSRVSLLTNTESRASIPAQVATFRLHRVVHARQQLCGEPPAPAATRQLIAYLAQKLKLKLKIENSNWFQFDQIEIKHRNNESRFLPYMCNVLVLEPSYLVTSTCVDRRSVAIWRIFSGVLLLKTTSPVSV
jgi:hypothetical protein